jgi:hypothetical protein
MEGQAPPPIVDVPTNVAPIEMSNNVQTDSSFSDGGALGSLTSGKMNIKDIVISALLITLSVYGIFYYRKAIKKSDEQLSEDEINGIYDRLDEHEENLKRAMGKNYKTT